MAAAAQALLAARRPVVIAGNGVRIAQGYEQLVALALDDEKLKAVFESFLENRRVPRFGNVFVNRTAVDGGDGGVKVGKGRNEDTDDTGAQLARAFQKPNALFPGHALVRHQEADFVLVSFEQLQSILRIVGSQNPKIITKGAGKRRKGHFFVVHIKDGEFFIIVIALHF